MPPLPHHPACGSRTGRFRTVNPPRPAATPPPEGIFGNVAGLFAKIRWSDVGEEAVKGGWGGWGTRDWRHRGCEVRVREVVIGRGDLWSDGQELPHLLGTIQVLRPGKLSGPSATKLHSCERSAIASSFPREPFMITIENILQAIVRFGGDICRVIKSLSEGTGWADIFRLSPAWAARMPVCRTHADFRRQIPVSGWSLCIRSNPFLMVTEGNAAGQTNTPANGKKWQIAFNYCCFSGDKRPLARVAKWQTHRT